MTGSASAPAVPRPGTEAPDFTLPSTSGEQVTLSSFRGSHQVLLAFFPLAFTSTCTAEVCEFSEELSCYRHGGTVVLPISVDSVPTLKAFKRVEGLEVDLLSDFHREVSRAYGVLREEENFAERAYVVIDPMGKVRWTHIEGRLGDKRGTEELMRHLELLD